MGGWKSLAKRPWAARRGIRSRGSCSRFWAFVNRNFRDDPPLVVVAMVNSSLAGNGRGRAVVDTLVDWASRLGGPAQPVLRVPGQPAPSQPTPEPQPCTGYCG